MNGLLFFLNSRKQKKAFIPKAKITDRIIAGLTHIERARGFLEAETLYETSVREIGRRALMLEAHHSRPYGKDKAEFVSASVADSPSTLAKIKGSPKWVPPK